MSYYYSYNVECGHCGKEFQAQTSSATYCSDSCRGKAYRARKKREPAALEKQALREEIATLRRELVRAQTKLTCLYELERVVSTMQYALRTAKDVHSRRAASGSELARHFHEAWSRLAPAHGYPEQLFAEVREAASQLPFDELPPNYKQLLIALCEDLEAYAAGTDDETR